MMSSLLGPPHHTHGARVVDLANGIKDTTRTRCVSCVDGHAQVELTVNACHHHVSRYRYVELTVNGVSLGRQAVPHLGIVHYNNITFAPGCHPHRAFL